MDAFVTCAKTKRRLQRTRRKNLRRREESKRSAQEDAHLRGGVYEAFARESAVEQGLDPRVWPFVPLSAEAAAQMGREYALIHSVERNHRLRPAPPRAPPPAEAPDRPGRQVCFANPLVTSDHAPAPHKAQRAVGCHTSALSVSPGCTELPTRLRRGGRVPSNEESPDSRVRFPSNEETPNRVRFPSYEETPNPPTPYRSGRSLPGPVGDDGTIRKYFSAGAKGGRVSHFIAV